MLSLAETQPVNIISRDENRIGLREAFLGILKSHFYLWFGKEHWHWMCQCAFFQGDCDFIEDSEISIQSKTDHWHCLMIDDNRKNRHKTFSQLI